jgi:hypothetical protein
LNVFHLMSVDTIILTPEVLNVFHLTSVETIILTILKY